MLNRAGINFSVMELLQKALFNLPRDGPQRPLDKLGLSQMYSGGVSATPSVEAVSPSIVFDIASLVLYGTHAIPVRLKILLDRLFSVLSQDEVVHILKTYGWTLEDYQRGYILKDHRSGAPLERWQMCSKEEEPLVLQQFLRFGETRPITQQLLQQEINEKFNEEQRLRAHAELKRLIEQNRERLQHAAARSSPPNNGRGEAASPRSHASPQPPSASSPASTPSSLVSPKHAHPAASPPSSTPTSLNGTAVPPSSPLSATSPLNRLQSMQPFDYRKDRKTPESRPIPPTIPPGMRMPGAASMGLPLMASVSAGGMPPGLANYSNTMANLSNKNRNDDRNSSKSDSENSTSVLNLSRGERGRTGTPTPPYINEGLHDDMKKKLRDNIGISFVNPATGKKRVQCQVCLKTFCDKGALKIHFSAVHLREMHRCSVEGCNMMFSSRRSRNRHSANPNPKLRTPHLRRKISPHDGRTHQGPVLPLHNAFGPPTSVAHPPPKQFPIPGLGPLGQFPLPGQFPGGFPPPHMLPPELQNLQRHQMAELQRLQEMKMYNHHLDKMKDESDAKRAKYADSDNGDDNGSVDNHSSKDETSSGTHSVAGGRKRKSQNPTRILSNAAPAATPTEGDEGDLSSDDDDEGFENPLLDDVDEEDDLDDDDDDDQLGGSGTGGGSKFGGGSPGGRSSGNESESKSEKKDDGKNGSKDEQTDKTNNNDGEEDDRSSSPFEPLAEIPVDKENPRRCVECGEEFDNHFAVKTHYQSVHLKLLHKCTIEGCNAGFPSKRSRDRHASNLNLHRKLLSTTSLASEAEAKTSTASSFSPAVSTAFSPLAAAVAAAAASGDRGAPAPSYHNEFLARLYAESPAAAAAAAAIQQHASSPFNSEFNSHIPTSMASFLGAAKKDVPPFGLFPGLPGFGPLAAGLVNNPYLKDAKITPEKFRSQMNGLLAEVGNHS